MSVIAAKWTIAEYHLMISAGILADRRVELLKGEIVEMSPEGEAHAYFSSEAGAYLIGLLGDRATIQKSPIKTYNLSTFISITPYLAIGSDRTLPEIFSINRDRNNRKAIVLCPIILKRICFPRTQSSLRQETSPLQIGYLIPKF